MESAADGLYLVIMSRAIWTGSITFGLVTIPVQLASAVQEKRISFHLLTADGQCRLRRKLVCPDTGKEYDYDQTARGFEIAPDRYVVVEPDELEKLKPQSGRTIEIKHFSKLSEIDPVYFDRPYYLLPDENGAKPYALLVEAIKQSGLVAVAQFVMREHEYLAAIRVKDNFLVLETMHYADEVLDLPDVESRGPGVVDKREMKLALQVLNSLIEPFDPGRFKDDYRERVQELIDKKAKGQRITFPETARVPGKVVNLMDALKASLAKGKKRQKPAGKERPPEERPHARTKAAKRTANTR